MKTLTKFWAAGALVLSLSSNAQAKIDPDVVFCALVYEASFNIMLDIQCGQSLIDQVNFYNKIEDEGLRDLYLDLVRNAHDMPIVDGDVKKRKFAKFFATAEYETCYNALST